MPLPPGLATWQVPKKVRDRDLKSFGTRPGPGLSGPPPSGKPKKYYFC